MPRQRKEITRSHNERTQLFLSNEPLVGWFFLKESHKLASMDADDFRQELRIVLWNCTAFFDSSKARFSTYAARAFYLWLSGEIDRNTRKPPMPNLGRFRFAEDDKDIIHPVAAPIRVDAVAALRDITERCTTLTDREREAWMAAVRGDKGMVMARRIGITHQRIAQLRWNAMEKLAEVAETTEWDIEP